MDKNAANERQRVRKQLKAILKGVEFCAKYELPLRGHRDSGPLTLNDPTNNDGVLRGFLRAIGRAGDTDITSLLNAPLNATYLSHDSVNELLNALSTYRLNQVLHRVKKSKKFTILADETSEYLREYISLVVRYVDMDTLKIKVCFK